MKLVVVQPLLPSYDISFFNRVAELHPEIELILLADIETNNSLNQYRPEACEFKIRHLPGIDWRGLTFRPGLLRLLGQEGADVVVFSANPRDISQLWAMLVYRLKKRRFFAWGMFHRIGGLRPVSKIYYRIVGRLASKCLTYTRIGATSLVHIGVPKVKVGIVGTAIDERIPLAQCEAKSREQLNAFRQQQDLLGKHVILQVVRLSRIKRPELLVQAAEHLLGKRNDLLFVLIGDGEMRQELEALVAAKNMKWAFRFLGAIYDEAILASWYMSADAFVVPTCIGLSAHHAMCYGVPIITDDSLDNQASEFAILANGLNALTYTEGDIGSLARAISRVVDNVGLREQISRNAIFSVRNIYSIDKKSENFINQISGH